ncbi:cyclin-dependent kinase 2-like [Embiotoca jacksoni]|uniref:cyclin-dependent kinase 2-like n=1 Tax=Embiotoca jacksoni TaxID=100190 RepID=UPI003703722D
MENYVKDSIVGKGAYGTVYKVKCQTTRKIFALKCHTHRVEEATVRELSCLAALKGHPYVIQMHDCFLDNGKIATAMPFVPYTLSEVIHNGHGLTLCDKQNQLLQLIPLSFMAHFSIQVAIALSYMHRVNIVHRDLTPSNVLLMEDLTIQVADMGLTRQSSKQMSSSVVTVSYRAPELFVPDTCADYTCVIDMWSLGVMIVDVMEGKAVFLQRRHGSETVSTYQLIVRTLCSQRPHLCNINTLGV